MWVYWNFDSLWVWCITWRIKIIAQGHLINSTTRWVWTRVGQNGETKYKRGVFKKWWNFRSKIKFYWRRISKRRPKVPHLKIHPSCSSSFTHCDFFFLLGFLYLRRRRRRKGVGTVNQSRTQADAERLGIALQLEITRGPEPFRSRSATRPPLRRSHHRWRPSSPVPSASPPPSTPPRRWSSARTQTYPSNSSLHGNPSWFPNLFIICLAEA